MSIFQNKKIKKIIGLILLLTCFFILISQQNTSYAGHCRYETRTHEPRLRRPVNQHTSNKFQEHRTWFLGAFFKDQILPALMLFTEQMSAVAMQQTMSIGMFLDAKHQLETQRLIQELQVEAHIDYQPSQDFCWFGTNVRSLAASEQQGRDNAYILSRRQIARELGEQNMGGAPNGDNDKWARWEMFTELFCDPQDSDWVQTQPAETGLDDICNNSYPIFTNTDIDYTRLIDKNSTIALEEGYSGFDLASNSVSSFPERAVMALQNNLYGHQLPMRVSDKELFRQESYQSGYLALRSITAKRSVAQNSFNAIVGLKAAGTSSIAQGGAAGNPNTYQFLVAIMRELGLSDASVAGTPAAEITSITGEAFSYYAQLEMLAKRIYQNPDFYANLYDKPANVKRKSVALKAIELMIDREIYESQIRQEMVSSVLLSTRLNTPFNEADKGLGAEEN